MKCNVGGVDVEGAIRERRMGGLGHRGAEEKFGIAVPIYLSAWRLPHNASRRRLFTATPICQFVSFDSNIAPNLGQHLERQYSKFMERKGMRSIMAIVKVLN